MTHFPGSPCERPEKGRVSMRATLALLGLTALSSLCQPAVTLADTIEPARQTFWAFTKVCVAIDAKKAWQRQDIGTVFKHPKITADDTEAWSVDDAKYARVGARGHRGPDAEALDVWSKYKFTFDAPFGALIVRSDDGTMRAATTDAVSITLPSTRYLDFRVNDTGLDDNGGELQVCITEGN